MAARLRTGRPRNWDSISDRSKKCISSLQNLVQLEPVHTGALSPEIKRTGSEAGHSYPYNNEIRNAWIYIYILWYIFVIVFN
jgi:hypothetical protein